MFGKELPCTIATDLFYIKLIANKTNFISSVISQYNRVNECEIRNE